MSTVGRRFFEVAFLFEFGMGVVAVVIAWSFGLRLWNHFSVDSASLGVSIVATGLALLFYLLLRSLPFACFRRTVDLVRAIFRSELQSLPTWKLALLALAAGFGEELLFRGLLQKGLCNLSDGNEPIIIVAVSLLFGLLHCLSKTYVILAFLISVYLGLLFLWTDNLFVVITVHALYDFVVLLHLRFERGSSATNDGASG